MTLEHIIITLRLWQRIWAETEKNLSQRLENEASVCVPGFPIVAVAIDDEMQELAACFYDKRRSIEERNDAQVKLITSIITRGLLSIAQGTPWEEAQSACLDEILRLQLQKTIEI